MLYITIPAQIGWDYEKEEFVRIGKDVTIQLEHSLISIHKWESKWNKPYLSNEKQSDEEALDYIRCMTITQNVKPEVYKQLTSDNILEIKNYIEAPMTAYNIKDDEPKKINGEVITAELIYYWMISLNIPPEYQKWHLNSLIALIKLCSKKQTPPKKMSKEEIIRRNADLNKQRREQYKTKG